MGYAELTLIEDVGALVVVAGFVAALVLVLEGAGVDLVAVGLEVLLDVAGAVVSVWGFFVTGCSSLSASSRLIFLLDGLDSYVVGVGVFEPVLLFRLYTPFVNWLSAAESIVQNAPFPGSLSPRGTFTNALLSDKLCRIEF